MNSTSLIVKQLLPLRHLHLCLWHSVALAVLAPIDQTPSKIRSDCQQFWELKLMKYQCAKQCLKLTHANRTTWQHLLLWTATITTTWSLFINTSKLVTPNVYDSGFVQTFICVFPGLSRTWKDQIQGFSRTQKSFFSRTFQETFHSKH